MKTYTVEFDAKELIEMISICNTAIVFEEEILKHLPYDSKVRESVSNDIANIEVLKGKFLDTVRNSLEGREGK